MLHYIARRLAQAVALLLVMSLLAFVAIYAVGDPLAALSNPNASPAEVARTAHDLGLDLPLYQQYARFLGHLLHGDLGSSYISGQPALGLILSRFPATLELTLSAMLIGVPIGMALGLFAGCRPRSLAGRFAGGLSVLLISIPPFWLGLALITVFCIEVHWLPTGGRGELGDWLGWHTSLATADGLRHLFLPALNLAFYPMALMLRLTRAGVMETLGMPFVRYARAKGLGMRRLIFVYVLRHILVPIVTVLGMLFGTLLAFSVVTETIFSWPGTGQLVIQAIRGSDRPVVIAYLIFAAAIFVVINIVVDIACALLDPRISLKAGADA